MSATNKITNQTTANKNTKKLGQNTAEYLLLLLLIGGGSVVAFKTFGKGIMNRFASVTNIIGGNKAINAEEVKDTGEVDFKTFETKGESSN